MCGTIGESGKIKVGIGLITDLLMLSLTGFYLLTDLINRL